MPDTEKYLKSRKDRQSLDKARVTAALPLQNRRTVGRSPRWPSTYRIIDPWFSLWALHAFLSFLLAMSPKNQKTLYLLLSPLVPAGLLDRNDSRSEFLTVG